MQHRDTPECKWADYLPAPRSWQPNCTYTYECPDVDTRRLFAGIFPGTKVNHGKHGRHGKERLWNGSAGLRPFPFHAFRVFRGS